MSNPLDIHKAIGSYFDPGKPHPTVRFSMFKAAQDAIFDLRPTFQEAIALVKLLQHSLDIHYPQDIGKVAEATQIMVDALLEADATEEREHDEMTNRLHIISEKGE